MSIVNRFLISMEPLRKGDLYNVLEITDKNLNSAVTRPMYFKTLLECVQSGSISNLKKDGKNRVTGVGFSLDKLNMNKNFGHNQIIGKRKENGIWKYAILGMDGVITFRDREECIGMVKEGLIVNYKVKKIENKSTLRQIQEFKLIEFDEVDNGITDTNKDISYSDLRDLLIKNGFKLNYTREFTWTDKEDSFKCCHYIYINDNGCLISFSYVKDPKSIYHKLEYFGGKIYCQRESDTQFVNYEGVTITNITGDVYSYAIDLKDTALSKLENIQSYGKEVLTYVVSLGTENGFMDMIVNPSQMKVANKYSEKYSSPSVKNMILQAYGYYNIQSFKEMKLQILFNFVYFDWDKMIGKYIKDVVDLGKLTFRECDKLISRVFTGKGFNSSKECYKEYNKNELYSEDFDSLENRIEVRKNRHDFILRNLAKLPLVRVENNSLKFSFLHQN